MAGLAMAMLTSAHSLAHILESHQLLQPDVSNYYIETAEREQEPFLHFLVKRKIVTPEQISKACAKHFKTRSIDLKNWDETLTLDSLLPHLLDYSFLPIQWVRNKLTLAVSDPHQMKRIHDLQFQMNVTIEAVFAPHDQHITCINKIVSQHIYNICKANFSHVSNVVTLTNQLVTDAIYREASDIHIEAERHHCQIRFRIDGILYEIIKFPKEYHSAIISRFKVLAELDIAEKRLPQDGRFTFQAQTGITRDCRLSSCPTMLGEKMVIRLLQPNHYSHDFVELGLDKIEKSQVLNSIHQPQGLILIAGPTGSGKTTTLYTLLNYLNSREKNICTIEDPIEYQLDGINQVNVNNKIGFDFAKAIRTFLRQDPNIIMVGEIRDLETASIAIRAAHTGHLVLSTLHTTSALESIARLINLGVERFNVASTLNLIIAQRLIRKSCPTCKNKKECGFCLKGYQGRTALFEILSINERLRNGILQNQPPSWLMQQAKAAGMRTLYESGIEKVRNGITTQQELERVLLT